MLCNVIVSYDVYNTSINCLLKIDTTDKSMSLAIVILIASLDCYFIAYLSCN